MFQYQPGTFVSVLSRNDANWGAYGSLGPKYNGYLLDGLPIDAFVDPMSLDVWALEKGEVHRGPASVMYANYLSMDFAGNQSPLAGTTNLMLKDRIEAPMTRLSLGYGSYETWTGRGYHQDHRGNFHYFLGTGYETSDYTDYGTPDSWLAMIDDPEYEKTKLYFKTTYFFNRDDHKISLFAHHTGHDGDMGRPNRDYDHHYDTINAAYRNAFTETLQTQFKAGYRHYDRRWGEDNYPDNLDLRSHDGVKQQILPIDLTFSMKHMTDSLLTVGADYQAVEYETYSETKGVETIGNDMTASNTGVFAEEKIVQDKWVFRVGGRYNRTAHDYDRIGGSVPDEKDKSWDELLYSAGVRFNAMKTLSLFTNVGTSFQAPSAKSVGGTLKGEDRGVPGKHGQLPNPNLKPESGIGSDFGVDIYPTDRLTCSVRGFFNRIDDAIVENRVSDNPSQSQSVNAGQTKSYGVEMEIKHMLNARLEWFANYTLTETEVTNDVDADQDGSDVPFVPDYTANIGMTAFLPYDLTGSVFLKAVGKYYDSTSLSGRKAFGPYEIVNMTIQKGIWTTAAHRSLLKLELNNLFDEKYEMPWQFMDPGVSVFLRFELQF
jgi:outer membrane receptor protein involved in Fe transport